MKKSITANFEQEMNTTRRFFDVITDEFFAYQPHEKSMDATKLMNHIAMIPAIVPAIVGGTGLDFSQVPPSEPATSKEAMITLFEANVAQANNALEQWEESQLTDPWTLKNGETTYINEAPKQDVMRNLIISHTIHHRAQLGVYLRMNNLKVPASYVASADESLL
jgi:uncharacterized damage-inducible protein DinB